MSAIIILTEIFATLFLVQLVCGVEDWDGVICYAGKKATPKMCNSCVTVTNNYTIVKRDCYESLSESERLACESGDAQCHHCTTELCNLGHPKHKCRTCDSQNNSDCLNDDSSLEMAQCLYDSNGLDDFYCYVKWDEDTGGNERGCISTSREYSECLHNQTTCRLCIADDSIACNAGEFPENRRKCIQCNNTSGECPTENASSELVEQYSVYCKNATDSCAIIDRGIDTFSQTCASEMTENEMEYCNGDQSQCSFCDGENNCNLKPRDTSTGRPSNATQHYHNRILLAIFIVISVMMT